MSKHIIQACIMLFSCASIFLFSTKEFYYLGFAVGLVGQPFWLYSSYKNRDWGIFFVAIWFTGMYIRGIINFW